MKQHLHILREGTGAEVKEFFGERCRFEQARARRRRAVQPYAACSGAALSFHQVAAVRLFARTSVRQRGPPLQASPRLLAAQAPRRAG